MLFYLLNLLLLILSSLHTTSYEIHRLLQYKTNTTLYGSLYSTINMNGVNINSNSIIENKVESKNCGIININDLTIIFLNRLVDKYNCLIIILASELIISSNDIHNIEYYLINNTFNIPIYFSNDNINIPLDSKYTLITSNNKEPSILQVSSTTFTTKLKKEKDLPILLIVAEYDTFGVIPTLSHSIRESGVVSLLTLSKLYGKLLSDQSNKMNIMFMLTSRQSGIQHWLTTTDINIIDNIAMVVCLEPLGGDTIYMHTRPSKKASTLKMQKLWEETAKKHNIRLEIITEKTEEKMSHETFLSKKIFAVTVATQIESRPSHPSLYLPKVNIDTLVKQIKFIANSIATLIYESDAPLDVVGKNGISVEYVTRWSNFLSSTSLSLISLHSNPQVLQEFEKSLSSYYAVFKTTHPSSITFYGNEKTTLNVYRTKSIWFDITLSTIAVLYLSTILIVIKRPTNLQELLKAFGI